MKEILEELTVASERFLRVRYTVRVGAPLVGLRWLGHYHLHNKDHCTLKVHASNQNYFQHRKLVKCLQKFLWACCTVFNKQVFHHRSLNYEQYFSPVMHCTKNMVIRS
jgi:hypothetical protein